MLSLLFNANYGYSTYSEWHSDLYRTSANTCTLHVDYIHDPHAFIICTDVSLL